jgi:hypothetical protein
MRPPSPADPSGAYVAVADPPGRSAVHHSYDGSILDGRWYGGGGKLISPYAQLSNAFAKPEDGRTDWERRTVAATRWLSRASRSTTAADRLVSVMVALEALFIRDRTEQVKGTTIARRMSERIRRSSMSREVQEAWVADLYQRRNDAVHEGREHLNDLEVEELLDMARFTVQFAAEHLTSRHSRRRACRTFDEAMGCPLWYLATS